MYHETIMSLYIERDNLLCNISTNSLFVTFATSLLGISLKGRQHKDLLVTQSKKSKDDRHQT